MNHLSGIKYLHNTADNYFKKLNKGYEKRGAEYVM